MVKEAAYGKSVWFWHPWLVSNRRRFSRSPTGSRKTVNSPMTEARGIRLRGEHGISRKTTVQGMPECSDCTCMLVCALLAHFAHETAGAASTRHSLRPLFFGRNDWQSPGETRCGNVKVCPTVIAEDGFSGRVDRSRRNASSDIRPIIGGAPGRHSEECRQHQSRHKQNHRGKMAHALASQPALHSISQNEHGLPSRKMQPG